MTRKRDRGSNPLPSSRDSVGRKDAFFLQSINAEVVELADTVVLETTAIAREGSTPSFGTNCSPVAQWQRQRSQKPCSVGSNPTRATNFVAVWCNGSTRGSEPRRSGFES